MIEVVYMDHYSRNDAIRMKECMFIFTDNIRRSSSDNIIDHSSWYYQKYGSEPFDLYYPGTFTTAQVRGLDNAYPISVQKYCYSNGSFKGGQWFEDTDGNGDLFGDWLEFKKVIDDEIQTIKDNLWKYKVIVLPSGGEYGVLKRRTSDISPERTPRMYAYLKKKLEEILFEWC